MASPFVLLCSKANSFAAASIWRRLLMQAFSALVLLALMKLGPTMVAKIPKQKRTRTFEALAFHDIGEFRRAIRNQPTPTKLIAKTAKTEAKQNVRSFSTPPNRENPTSARPPSKRPTTEQPIPKISLSILI